MKLRLLVTLDGSEFATEVLHTATQPSLPAQPSLGSPALVASLRLAGPTGVASVRTPTNALTPLPVGAAPG